MCPEPSPAIKCHSEEVSDGPGASDQNGAFGYEVKEIVTADDEDPAVEEDDGELAETIGADH